MYKSETAPKLDNSFIGEGVGRSRPSLANLDGLPDRPRSGFSLAPKAQVAISRELVLSEAFDP